MNAAFIKVWFPGNNGNNVVVYAGAIIEDYSELDNGDTLLVVLKNGSRFRYHRLPYVVELNPIPGA